MSFKTYFWKVFWALVSAPCALPKTCREDQSRAKPQVYTFQLSPELPRGNLTNLWRRQSHYLNTTAWMPSIILEVGTTPLKSKYFLLLLKILKSQNLFLGINVPGFCLKAKSLNKTLLRKTSQNMCFKCVYYFHVCISWLYS